MSFFTLLKKSDVIHYEKALQLKTQYYKAIQDSVNNRDALLRDGINPNKTLNSLTGQQIIRLLEVLQAIVNKHKELKEQIIFEENQVSFIGPFDKQPEDLENYYVYYRGAQWGDASKEISTLSMQNSGIEKLQEQIIKSLKELAKPVITTDK